MSSFQLAGKYSMLAATLSFSLTEVCIKLLSQISSEQIVCFRSFVGSTLCLLILNKAKARFIFRNARILIIRSLIAASGLYLYVIAIKELPLALFTCIQNMTIFFTICFARLFFKETIEGKFWVNFLLVLLGLVVIKGISFDVKTLPAAAALGGSLLAGLSFNCLKKISLQEDPIVITLYFSLIGTLIFTPLAYEHWVSPSFKDLFLLLISSLLVWIGQYFLATSFSNSPQTSQVMMISATGILFSTFSGFLIFNEKLSAVGLIGIALVTLGVALQNFNFGLNQTAQLGRPKRKHQSATTF